MLGFSVAGLIAQTLYLGYRAVTAVDGAPLSSEFDWYLIAAWVLVVVYLYLTIYHPRTTFGLYVLPVVLALVGFATRFADRAPFPRSQAAQVWGMIHGIFLLLGTVAVAVGFAGGLMCLVQAYRLKHKLTPKPGLRLPSLEWLERLNIWAITISVAMLTVGFLSGTVLNLINNRLQIERLPWTDPIVWTSGLLLVWLIVAAGFTWLYKPARQGRKVAYLTVASFAFLVLAVVARLVLPSEHAVPKDAARAKAEPTKSAVEPMDRGARP